MANRNFPNNKLYQTAVAPARLDVTITIGASGAVSSSSGSFLKSVTKLGGAGMYRIRFQDNYYRFINMHSSVVAPLSGASVSGGSFVANTAYRITALGTTTQAQWETAGFPTGITAAVGMSFVATGIGAGTGTVQAIVTPVISQIVLMDNGQELNSSLVGSSQNGAVLNVLCLGPTDASTTTQIATNPASGSILKLSFLLDSSSVTIS